MSVPHCIFCAPPPERILHEDDEVVVLWDGFPVSAGHALVTPKRHIETWFDATADEHAALLRGIDRARAIIDEEHRPDGYNIGINVGEAAGQTVFHLHVHVIPRYRGDVANPRGGVRGVIPGKQDYRADPPRAEDHREPYQAEDAVTAAPPHHRALVMGDDDPLLAHLGAHLARAERLDVAVAFVQRSGVELLKPHLRDLLERGGRFRLLTGDYLDVSDPDALLAMCDLVGRHGKRVELRVFECTQGATFHPKAYLLHGAEGAGIAFVGSSNATRPALTRGVEWNYRIVDARDRSGFDSVAAGFERLFAHRATVPLDVPWIERYRARRKATPGLTVALGVEPEAPEPPPQPHPVQREALAALARTRSDGNRAGLVVLATGLGKTWLAAFDASRYEFDRVLFVAHREEILAQAAATFRRIRPDARIGRYSGAVRDADADVVLASIQTLSRAANLNRFAADAFDYVVIDEFHHAHARTYRTVIDHFEPAFLLGLTATPERSDGGDLLALCAENLVYRCDLPAAIDRELLVPFRYFGVPDEVDYNNIPWRNTRFDEEALTREVATRARADNALQQYRARAGRRTLGFCVSRRHADFMRDHFLAAGIRAASVHSGPTSDGRAASLDRLAAGELDTIFAVDMFNEGLDLPHIDTVMMLRPTESRVLWLQQIGRGLRKAEGKDRLTVIDYIGNHRTFLLKVQTLFDLRPGDANVERVLAMHDAGTLDLPPGCKVTYELEAVNIIRALLRPATGVRALQGFFNDFSDRHGHRPSATETFHEGLNPRAARPAHGSWLDFVRDMGGLDLDTENLLGDSRAGAFLRALEITPMNKSYKMLLVLAAIDVGGLPGVAAIDVVTARVRRLARRSDALRLDLGQAVDDEGALRKLLEENPIKAFTQGRGTGGTGYLAYSDGQLSTTFRLPEAQHGAFHDLVREIADWRLAEYLARPIAGDGEWICNVSHAGGRPIIFPPDRETHPDLPRGWIDIEIEGTRYRANFVKVALNVVRRPGNTDNVLPGILRGWFGQAAGQPGRRHRVRLRRRQGRWELRKT